MSAQELHRKNSMSSNRRIETWKPWPELLFQCKLDIHGTNMFLKDKKSSAGREWHWHRELSSSGHGNTRRSLSLGVYWMDYHV
jgi:hypothetical protein